MTLYHGITNILRYGDYSFINLKKMRVTEIGELKTKKIDDSTGECTLTVLARNELDGKEALIKDVSGLKERKERQIIGIANFLVNKKEPNPCQIDLINKSYAQDVESLIKSTRINKEGIVQVSEGLLFYCIKLRKRSLYSKIFSKTPKINYTNSDELIATAQKLMKPNNDRNSLIISTNASKKRPQRKLYSGDNSYVLASFECKSP